MTKTFCFGLMLTIALGIGCQRASNTPQVSVEEVWSRPVMLAEASDQNMMADSAMASMHHMDNTGVVYLTVQNRGGAPDRLLKAHANVCEATEIHETMMHGDHAMMHPVTGGLEIPAQGSLKLEPSGRHIMLIGLKHSLAAGDSIELHLEFEKSGLKTVFSTVRQP